METSWKEDIHGLKLLWETWDLRVVILSSLLLQTFLIFSAPFRKRTSTAYVLIPMWLAYLVADATATFAVGLISRSQGQFVNPELLAFWAPFLLVHLGGPDTITAYALEDNELWLRHLLLLLFHCGTIAYVFILTLPKSKLWLPTLLMFVAGFIKYTERARSLYLASSRRFRDSLLAVKEPDPGPEYVQLMDELSSRIGANIPVRIQTSQRPQRVPKATNEEPLKDLDVLRHAYLFFQTFKGLIADLILSFPERDQSRTFFRNRTARDAFKVVEVELSFFYEILYTKFRVVRGNYGYIFRVVSFILNIVALVHFRLIDKQGFDKFDIGITYILLAGAIALDIIALLMVLFSDWTAVALTKSDNLSIVSRILRKFLMVDRERWPEDSAQHFTCSFGWFMQIGRRRWSESLSQYSLVDYCLNPRSEWKEKIIGTFGITNILDGMKYVETVKFTDDLRDLIFEELKMKSAMTYDLEDAREINSARGDWTLLVEDCSNLLPWIDEVDYDESLLLWHIATELCCHSSEVSEVVNAANSGNANKKDFRVLSKLCCHSGEVSTDVNAANSGNANEKDLRVLSKLLSDYMLHLLIMQSTMMPAVASFGHVRFRDTCAEAKKVFRKRSIEKVGPEEVRKKACKTIYEVNTDYKPVTIKGSGSKSVLFDACRLAKELNKLGEERKWVVMSKVWVELLSYAASRCKARTHATQLGKGGQLITLVWLLMAHFGLGDQFQVSDYQPMTQIVVEK